MHFLLELHPCHLQHLSLKTLQGFVSLQKGGSSQPTCQGLWLEPSDSVLFKAGILM